MSFSVATSVGGISHTQSLPNSPVSKLKEVASYLNAASASKSAFSSTGLMKRPLLGDKSPLLLGDVGSSGSGSGAGGEKGGKFIQGKRGGKSLKQDYF